MASRRLTGLSIKATILCILLNIYPSAILAQPTHKIVYVQGSNIYAMNADGSNIQQLTTGRNSFNPHISPNGSQIVFVSDRDGNNEIYTMTITGGDVTRLTNNLVHETSPSWSADNSKIAYISGTPTASDIYIMNSNGSNSTNITNTVAIERGATWSPNGNKIAFSSNQAGYFQLYTISPDGSAYTQITNITSDLYGGFRWSPNGTKIAFKDNGEIFQISVDGSEFSAVTDSGGDIGDFFWLNNDQIIFTNTVAGWTLVNIDGSGRTVVNFYWPLEIYTPSFQSNTFLPVPASNLAPIANAGLDRTVLSPNLESKMTTLDGNGIDKDGQIERLDWYLNNKLIAGGPNPQVELALGVHTLTLVVTDDRGLTAQDSVTITVLLVGHQRK